MCELIVLLRQLQLIWIYLHAFREFFDIAKLFFWIRSSPCKKATIETSNISKWAVFQHHGYSLFVSNNNFPGFTVIIHSSVSEFWVMNSWEFGGLFSDWHFLDVETDRWRCSKFWWWWTCWHCRCLKSNPPTPFDRKKNMQKEMLPRKVIPRLWKMVVGRQGYLNLILI